MSHLELSSFEAKQLAAYLKASAALVPGAIPELKLGQWLNALSHASGFRDWNTMKAVAPEVQEITWGTWHSAFFGIAQIHIQGHPTSLHLSGFRNSIPESESSRHEVASQLARSCLKLDTESFRGLSFTYSRPDLKKDSFFDSYFISPSGKWTGPSPKPWRETTPIVVTSSDNKATVLLWWLTESCTMSSSSTEGDGLHCQSLVFNDDGCPRTGVFYRARIPQSLTDLFLYELTNTRRTPRSCYYVPEVANSDDQTFVPVMVREGYKDGEKTNFNFGPSRDEAIERTRDLNAQIGVTQLDAESIAQTFRDYEEKAVGIEFDYFGGSPYDD